jgi:hypothetical protein
LTLQAGKRSELYGKQSEDPWTAIEGADGDKSVSWALVRRFLFCLSLWSPSWKS